MSALNWTQKVGLPPRSKRERGSAAIELAAAIPIVILVLAALLQVASVVSTTSVANQAARDGARAASLGHSASAAVEKSLPGNMVPKSVQTLPDGGVEVQLEAKRVVPFMPSLTVTRSVDMP